MPSPATNTDATATSELAAAAILDDGSCDADALLAEVAARQLRQGRRVRGLLMTHPQGHAGCAAPMVLVDLHTKETYLVSQTLGACSSACRADTQGFARASRVLRDALAAAPELVLSNRFGGLESEGGGFAAELLELMAQGVPLLTVVAPRHLLAWQRFTGSARVLPADADAVAAWLDQVLAPQAAA